uniref:Mucin-2-like n=1 Tax=Schistosoma mansoni TaxID=6183 RepID=A0A5K4FAL0_SCHMA
MVIFSSYWPISFHFVLSNKKIVSTNYWIDSTIYHQTNNSAIDWDPSYADTTSLNYAVLSKQYCYLIMRTLEKATLTANKQKACTKVVFSPRQILIIWEKRQATSNTTSNVVGGNATIQINSTSTDVINTTDFTNAFTTTYNTSVQSNDTIQLYDIQTGL